jgi:peptidyl-prolyl cis-trans isomerase C
LALNHKLPRILLLILVAASALGLPGCRLREPKTPPGIVARVGARHVSVEEFKAWLQRNTGSELAQISPEAASPLLDQYVDEVLLSEFAAANGSEVSADKVAAAVREDAGSTIDSKRDELRRQALVTSIADSIPTPTDAEILAFYNQNQDEFRIPEQVRVRQILVRDEASAKAVAAKLKAGQDFGNVSREYSTAPNADRGGEIGLVARGQLPRIFEDVIFRLQPGQYSEIVEANSNFHVFLVEAHSPSRTLPLEEVRGMIRVKLEADAADLGIQETLAKARQAFPVTILTRRLPFPYAGSYPVSGNE